MAISPTVRALAYFRQRGWTCQVVERFNSFSKKRIDLFNIIDIVCINPDVPYILGVQVTTRSNQANRITKALANPYLRTWLQAGGRFLVMGWAKVGKVNTVKRWRPSIRNITLEELAE